MEQKVLFFKKDDIDYIGSQLKDLIEKHCVDGWYVHQIQPTHQEEHNRGNLRLHAAVIILHRKTAVSNYAKSPD